MVYKFSETEDESIYAAIEHKFKGHQQPSQAAITSNEEALKKQIRTLDKKLQEAKKDGSGSGGVKHTYTYLPQIQAL